MLGNISQFLPSGRHQTDDGPSISVNQKPGAEFASILSSTRPKDDASAHGSTLALDQKNGVSTTEQSNGKDKSTDSHFSDAKTPFGANLSKGDPGHDVDKDTIDRTELESSTLKSGRDDTSKKAGLQASLGLDWNVAPEPIENVETRQAEAELTEIRPAWSAQTASSPSSDVTPRAVATFPIYEGPQRIASGAVQRAPTESVAQNMDEEWHGLPHRPNEDAAYSSTDLFATDTAPPRGAEISGGSTTSALLVGPQGTLNTRLLGSSDASEERQSNGGQSHHSTLPSHHSGILTGQFAQPVNGFPARNGAVSVADSENQRHPEHNLAMKVSANDRSGAPRTVPISADVADMSARAVGSYGPVLANTQNVRLGDATPILGKNLEPIGQGRAQAAALDSTAKAEIQATISAMEATKSMAAAKVVGGSGFNSSFIEAAGDRIDTTQSSEARQLNHLLQQAKYSNFSQISQAAGDRRDPMDAARSVEARIVPANQDPFYRWGAQPAASGPSVITIGPAGDRARIADQSLQPYEHVEKTLAKVDAELSVATQGEARFASVGSSATVQNLAATNHHATQIIRQMMEVSGQLRDGGPVEVSLSPEELGRVRMHILSNEQGVVMQITAERSETLDMLRRHIDQLHRDLSSMGYDNPRFSFNREGDQGKGQAQFESASSDTGMPDSSKQQSPVIVSLTTDGLDIRI